MNVFTDLWAILTDQQRRWVMAAQVILICMAFSTVIGIASIAPFFSVLGDPNLIEATVPLHWLYHVLGFTSQRSFEIGLGLAFLSVVIAANVVNALGTTFLVRLAWRITTEMQSSLFREYLSRPYAFHAKTHSTVLFNNIIYNTTRVTSMLQNAFILATGAVTATFIFLSVLYLNPAVATALVLALTSGYFVIYRLMGSRLQRAGEIQSRVFAEQSKIVNESLGAIKETIVSRVQSFFRHKFDLASGAFARAAGHTQLVGQSPRYLMECMAVTGMVLVALLTGRDNENAGAWLGQLTFLAFAAYRLLPALHQCFASVVGIRADRAGYLAIAPDLRIARSSRRVNPDADSSWRGRPSRDIKIDALSFRYATERPLALDDVSVVIRAGTAVGIIGTNGSGKTTLADLLTGLLVPTTGHIEVDGILLDASNREDWQSQIAYVPQNIFLLDTSIANNIALGISEADIDRDRVVASAEFALLGDLIKSLPNGYDHVVGERGVTLSGGQRQRVAIARAIYRNARVLVLDEATSALDGMTEQELISTVLKLRGEYTIILIAQRLSTLRACNLIIELQHGAMKARGSYDEVLRGSETFRSLAEIE